MKLGIMQPYLFPYIGYFQLINSTDVFVLYDDVNYIKQGYINRNNILSNGTPLRITLPVINASSFKKINELEFSKETKKILKTLEQSYSKAPYYKAVFPMIHDVLTSPERKVSHLCGEGIKKTLEYLNIKKIIEYSSEIDYERERSASDKIISMAKIKSADCYINSIGGQELYNYDYFNLNNIKLSFIKMNNINYLQPCREFVPNLSIIDALMWCEPREICDMLNNYQLVTKS